MSTKITSSGSLDAGSLGRLPTKEGGTIHFGGYKREAVIGDNGVLGYTEIFESAPSIKVTITHSNSTDEKNIQNFVGENLTLSLNSGKKYTLMGAWTSEPLEVSIKDGQLDVLFVGTELIPL